MNNTGTKYQAKFNTIHPKGVWAKFLVSKHSGCVLPSASAMNSSIPGLEMSPMTVSEVLGSQKSRN